MKIVHILGSATMFTKDTYEMIDKYINGKEDEHYFIAKFPEHPNFSNGSCRIIKSKSLGMFIALNSADYIIIHGMINKLVVLIFSAQPWLLKKCNWIVWGGDIYIHEKSKKSLSERLTEILKKIILPYIPVVTTVSAGDYDLAKKWYGVKGKECHIVYPVPAGDISLLREIHENKEKSASSTINIIVGNSATETNQHFDALDLLAKFKDDNIRIFLPLNYGTGNYQEYADRVAKYAKDIFGDKVETLREQLPGEEYLRYLGKMHVGIFNNNRQQAMGNISQLIACGAKVYIRDDTKMWMHFQELGCKLSSIQEIMNMNSLNELIFQDSETKNQNMSIIMARHDVNAKVKQWNAMISTMKTECGKKD